MWEFGIGRCFGVRVTGLRTTPGAISGVPSPRAVPPPRRLVLVLVILTITSVIGIAPGERVLGSVVMGTSALAAAVAALLAPVRGVHRQIRREKQRQLRTLRVQIDAQRRAVLEGQPDAAELARLPGLLALESRLEAVREWPFDTSSLARFGLYLLIGLGSWIGAAMVERLIDWGIR